MCYSLTYRSKYISSHKDNESKLRQHVALKVINTPYILQLINSDVDTSQTLRTPTIKANLQMSSRSSTGELTKTQVYQDSRVAERVKSTRSLPTLPRTKCQYEQEA
ncbi:hypothetical protein QYE76_031058 [Lolium multiflorum]|uniref:Uncharacterized protein n=1 Tax=Lolium multiflorum TaxID=4521 RepID=A0AAD8VJU2_LOLMU|nr:hypothetical protein QYE76_031058 [Lolium multiflorum]